MSELDRFAASLKVLLPNEGGYVDDPQDPGGATNLGVTLAVAKEARLDMDHDGDVDKLDVRALTPAVVAPIYHRLYWLAASCDKCPAGLDLMVFEAAVNQGPGRAVRWLQQIAGVAADGLVGPQTVAAVNRLAPVNAIMEYAKLREAHYRSLSTFPRFGNGWIRRLTETVTRCRALAS